MESGFNIRILIKMIVTGVIAISTGFLLLLAVFVIPTDRMMDNIKSCLSAYGKEGDYYVGMPGYASSIYDNVTDAVYFSQAMVGVDEDRLLQTALGGYNYYSTADETKRIIEKIQDYFDPAQQEYIEKESTHARFWNGYLIWLKPLLTFMTYGSMRMMNLMFQIVILFTVLFLMHEKGLHRYEIPFILSYTLMNPIAISMNIFFSGFFYCTFIPVLILLIRKNWPKDSYILFFEIIGICVAYFNMNSFQLISWGYSLIFLLLINGMPKKTINLIKVTVTSFIAWFLGYAGMLVSKWILTYYLTDIDIIGFVGDTLIFRVGNEVPIADEMVELTRFSAIALNISVIIKNRFWLIAEIAFILIVITMTVRKKRVLDYNKSWGVLSLLILAVTCLRYILLLNHSYIHYAYVYRICSISVFSINCSLIAWLFGTKQNTEGFL